MSVHTHFEMVAWFNQESKMVEKLQTKMFPLNKNSFILQICLQLEKESSETVAVSKMGSH